jgi:hypothetical protein
MNQYVVLYCIVAVAKLFICYDESAAREMNFRSKYECIMRFRIFTYNQKLL